ncbi:hepatocyte growth factor receptor-like isoform X2 [Mytilus californianus]|uniref:hepatocyte growth factor receptor-like isoform X2 n=1 Tax=Mytilus californianus TaxID=6549 RepID=UPI0022452D20|nr:hepatocyte growth factor receptor-like isoform X2 [Mytilus californianus]
MLDQTTVLLIQTTVMLTVTAQLNLTPFGNGSQSSYISDVDGNPEYAVNPPMSNEYSLDKCSSSTEKVGQARGAWWIFEFSFDTAYITDITIYYRENNAFEMDGFQLYVTNTPTIPPNGFLCYEDPKPGLPNIRQTIPCYHLGKYVIYYDRTGYELESIPYAPTVSLCYVAIYGCEKNFWGSNCDISCAESCIEKHCFPGNGSCILGGCSDKNCLNSNCDQYTAVCTEGCKERRTGNFCNKYNLAFDSSILFNSTRNEQAILANDGNKTSCVPSHGSEMWVQVDLKEISVVTEIYLTLIVNITKEGNHTLYASNYSGLWENGTVLFRGESLPTVINVSAVFRYLIYEPPIQNQIFKLEVCEIGIVGCPPTHFGPFCSKLCPAYCSGPCDIETGNCLFGCVNKWIGDKCDLGPSCYETNSDNLTTNCSPEIDQVYPASGPVNGGTLLTLTGNYLGNVNDSIFVDISGVRCHNVTVQTPYTDLTCVTGKYTALQTIGLFVWVNANYFSDSNTKYFTFKVPKILEFLPKKGILSGNTTVTIRGLNIDFEGQSRYNISFCDDVFCLKCSVLPKTISPTIIKCKTGKSVEPRNMTQLNVVIDDLTVLTLKETFQYLPDPTFDISTELPKALQGGGVVFSIRGNGFNNVGAITVERVDNPCDVPEDTSTECETPPRLQNQPNNQTIEVNFDGVTIQVTLEYVNDPTFERFQGIVEYDMESSIEIKGRNILNVARYHDYHINIGLDGSCLISDINMELITCIPPKSVPRTNKTDVTTVHVIVNVIRIHIYIGDIQYITETNTFAIVVGLLGAGLVGSVIMGMSAFSILRRKKTKAANEFKMEIKAKEEIIQKARRDGMSERRRNVRVEDGDEDTEPEESIYDEINADEENNTPENSYLDVHGGYDELGQRPPTNPYNQLQHENQNQDTINNVTNADDELQCNTRRNDYLSLFNGYDEPISRNYPDNPLQHERVDNNNSMTNLDNSITDSSLNDYINLRKYD